MNDNTVITGIIFLAVSSLTLLLFLVAGGRRNRLDTRLHQLANPTSDAPPVDAVADFARTALPRMGTVLVPKSEEERTKLQTRLIQAGLYSRQAMVVFLGVKMVLMLGPAIVGMMLGLSGLVEIEYGFLFGCLAGVFGLVGPSFWLDKQKAARQTNFRRALPDALDVLVICLEGGSSLPSALARVAAELRVVHPLLAFELNIVQREVQMGRSPGESLKQFAYRADLEEIRGLASVILQAERFGASLVKAIRVHAESLRGRRIMDAEEKAQKAVVTMLFPTALFILPALFMAILGPLGVRVLELLESTGF